MTKIWLKAAAIRAVRSFAQGVLASIGTGAVLTEVNWLAALCTGALAALVSVLMSLAGLPEAKPDVMSGAGENFDLNGADRPRKCVASITEIMELMGFEPIGGSDDAPDDGAQTDADTPNGPDATHTPDISDDDGVTDSDDSAEDADATAVTDSDKSRIAADGISANTESAGNTGDIVADAAGMTGESGSTDGGETKPPEEADDGEDL